MTFTLISVIQKDFVCGPIALELPLTPSVSCVHRKTDSSLKEHDCETGRSATAARSIGDFHGVFAGWDHRLL